jgi:hypothetical protein
MKINIISYEPENGWILFDYAKKLYDSLLGKVEEVKLSHSQINGYDVSFHVNYAGLTQILVPGLHTTMVTHIDTKEKFEFIRAQANHGVQGFCMSEETARRLNTFTGLNNFYNFNPPCMRGYYEIKTKFLIAARTYSDGRKNESLAMDFFRSFSSESIEIIIIGAGWELYVDDLLKNGYKVEYYPQFSLDQYLELLEKADYLLVTGFDEGALSVLDAIMYDVIPIATSQGYHLEQSSDILLFSNYDGLMEISRKLKNKIKEKKEIREKLADWNTFAEKHLSTWTKLLSNIK